MKIVVLGGGISTERHVSLVSGTSVCKALRSLGHKAIFVDMFLGLEDYANEIFTRYSARLFSFQEVRAEMVRLQGKGPGGKVNLKKFLDGLLILAEEE